MNAPGPILLVGPAWLGDAVMAHGLIRMMRALWHDAAIDLVSPPSLAGLYELMPEIREVFSLGAGHGDLALGARRKLGRRLRARNYAISIVVSRSLKAALVPFFAGVQERRGFTGELRFGLVNRRLPEPPPATTPTLSRFGALLPEWREAPLLPSLRPAEAQITQVCERFGIRGNGHALAICPGAAASADKRWPAEHFATLAADATARGQPVWILGAAADRLAAETIRQAVPQVIDLTGRTNLAEAAALLAAADRSVANDSGLMHLAAAVGTAVLGLYGPTDPAVNPPLGSQCQVLRAESRNGVPAIADLEPARVLAALEAM